MGQVPSAADAEVSSPPPSPPPPPAPPTARRVGQSRARIAIANRQTRSGPAPGPDASEQGPARLRFGALAGVTNGSAAAAPAQVAPLEGPPPPPAAHTTLLREMIQTSFCSPELYILVG